MWLCDDNGYDNDGYGGDGDIDGVDCYNGDDDGDDGNCKDDIPDDGPRDNNYDKYFDGHDYDDQHYGDMNDHHPLWQWR